MLSSKAALWESGHDETVEVNQRALIDKVLARYSGEFTVFRELLQNSDDAQSKAVEIRFETQDYLDRSGEGGSTLETTSSSTALVPDLKTTTVHQWTFKNDGIAFRDEDWNRLKKIAEGNPDEEKIGAFGVGFYSLFSVTEEPFVSSGAKWMGFYWKDKKDQLFARRGTLPETNEDQQSNIWTSFTMGLRDPNPMPSPFDLTRFLASSITFMRHLSEITVYFDDKRLVKLNKISGLPREISLHKTYNNRSPERMMTVTSVESRPVFIQVEAMRWIYTYGTKKVSHSLAKTIKSNPTSSFFSSLYSSFTKGVNNTPSLPDTKVEKPTDPYEITQTGVSLSIFSATVQVNLDKKMTTELVRSTKKNPPSKMRFELIYTSKDEFDTSLKEDAQAGISGSIFQGLRADLQKSGDAKVFIGHSTSQSTGIGGHIAARFIPTVERESIDFMDRYVATWNKELLYAGGFLARVAYDDELKMVQQEWDAAHVGSTLPSTEIQSKLIGRILHAANFFDFYDSQPSREVSSHLREAFFSCSSSANFQMISSIGIRMAKSIRLPDPLLGSFMVNIPWLPKEILEADPTIIQYLKYSGMIRNVEFSDIIQELQSRPLTLVESISCLSWWTTESRRDFPNDRSNYASIRKQFLDAIVITLDGDQTGNGRIVPLNSIKYYFNPKSQSVASIPVDGPLPDSLLPIAISKSFKPEEISAYFPWVEFNLHHWLDHICSQDDALNPEYNISLSPLWSERVIGVISRAWAHLAEDSKVSIKGLLRDKSCIPTNNGMKKPGEVYFPNVNMFPDLPIVKFPSNLPIRGNIEKVLQYLDVRRHVDLQIVFNRMIKTNEWTVTDLVKYLVSIKDLDEEEIQRLRSTAAFPREMKPGESVLKKPRYMAHQLYPPVDTFRSLGLPILDWGDHIRWRDRSDEAKFLYRIGLQHHPPLKGLIELCSGSDEKIREIAFQYLVEHVETEYSSLVSVADERFIPALKGSELCLANIKEVYSHSAWTAMGFLVIQPKYQPYVGKLKIKEHPSSGQFVHLLETNPPSASEASIWFSLLASRVNDFRPSDFERLSSLPFVPISRTKDGSPMKWLPPSQCYLRGDSHDTFHSQLFNFVDFGTTANAFLTACGTRNQPSVEEVAKILLNDPQHFYEISGGSMNFLAELRNLAVNERSLSHGTTLRMRKAPIFLGMKRKARKLSKANDEWDEEEWEIIYELRRSSDIVIADDTNAYQAFGDSLFAAPQEDILEGFYISFGSQRLSRLVREEHNTSSELFNSKIAQDSRQLILERLPLFLHEHTHMPTQVSFSWFSSGNNFVVRAFGKLSVIKYLNFGEAKVTKKQDASAVSMRRGSGSIELWVAGNSQIDMYEVATSLNRILFQSPKANDALLFMTILSTDLRSLKRRGYNVDRILRQQAEARLTAEKERLQRDKASAQQERQVAKPFAPPNSEPTPLSLAPKENGVPAPSTVTPTPPPTTGPLSGIFGRHLNFKRRTGVTDSQPPLVPEKPSVQDSSPSRHTSPPPDPQSPPKELTPNPPNNDYTLNQQYLSGAEHSKPQPKKDHVSDIMPGGFPSTGNVVSRGKTRQPTPLSDIARNIDLAIDSCKPQSGNLVQNREKMQMVKESVDDGYCDISGRRDNLHNIAEMGSVRIYLSDEIPLKDAESFMQSKKSSIARFIHVMRSLAPVFRLPLSNLHVFSDLAGGIIAFNRNGSIFLNLRYFEQWHDEKVTKGDLRDAYISWYFTIAHEIAHNLVQPHNSEHEFYFSAICEHFMMDLAKLLT